MDEPAQQPTADEALTILEAARKAGHLPEGFIERELAVVRGEMGDKAKLASALDEEREAEESPKILSL